MEEKEVENRSIRCVGCLYWDWNRYHLARFGADFEELAVIEMFYLLQMISHGY